MVNYRWENRTTYKDKQEGAKFYTLVATADDGREIDLYNIIYKKIWGSYLVTEGYKRFKTLTDAKIYAEKQYGIKLTRKKIDSFEHPFGL